LQACILAKRGYDVDVYEMRAGQLSLIAIPCKVKVVSLFGSDKRKPNTTLNHNEL